MPLIPFHEGGGGLQFGKWKQHQFQSIKGGRGAVPVWNSNILGFPKPSLDKYQTQPADPF